MKLKFHFHRWIFFTVALFLFFGSHGPAFAKPPLWKLADEDTTIFLLGTFHLLKEETVWYTREIDNAVKNSDALYTEITLEEIDGSEAWAYVRSRGFFQKGTYLTDYIGDAEFYRLQELISKAGGNNLLVFRMKPMLAAMVLAGAPYIEEELKRFYGAEEVLVRRARKFRVPLKGLTSLEVHMGSVFDYPVEIQLNFLRETMDDATREFTDVDDLISAWKSGNLKALDIHENEAMGKFPEIREKLLYGRNQLWVDQIVEMMTKPGQIFIAVGAAHFVGPKNVIELLENEGFNPVRQ